MIRRPSNNAWLLIPQPAHAKVASDLAAVWGNAAFASLPLADRLVPAVRHHDDGWSNWEAAPKIDPATGVPREFLEMPRHEATEIWSQSIDSCAQRSAFGGLWVSRHFQWLAEQTRESRDDEERKIIDRFLDEQAALQAELLDQAGTEFDRPEAERFVEVGFRWMQFFDRLSLWLCCSEKSDPFELATAESLSIRFVPRTSYEITVEPWPFRVEVVSLSVDALRVPERPYESDHDLRETMRVVNPESIAWSLRPA